MDDNKKTRDELLEELRELRAQVERSSSLPEERLQKFADSLPETVYETDLDGNLTFINSTAFEATGYTLQDLQEFSSPLEVIAPEDRERAHKNLKKTLQGGSGGVYEYTVMRKDGTQVPVIFHSRPILQEGRCVGTRGLIMDISSRKEAEEALRESEARIQSIFRAAPTGIGVVSNRVLVEVNTRMCEITGYTERELIGQSSRMLYLNDEDFQHVGKEKYEQIQADGTGTVETRWRRKSGEIIDILLSSTPIDPKDLTVGVTFTALDITERKQIEERLRQSQKMEGIGQLAGGIAHDFNNLLQGILGYTEMAKSGMSSDEQGYDDLEQVTKAANRAADLTRQLLAFSRRQMMQPVNLSLDDVVVNLSKMLRRIIGENIELILKLGPDSGTVHADPGMLEQILMNLSVNSRDAMPDGGTLTLQTEGIAVDEEFVKQHPWARIGHHVLLSVTDTGAGMPSEILEHVFEPFFTTKEVGKGTGLGLSTVYGIVKQHNGFIHCYSEPGQGTCIKVYLPDVGREAQKLEETGRDEETGESPKGTETILLAEDEAVVRNLAIRILEDSGYTVLVATDGEEALRLLESEIDRIDLAVLDIVMPKFGGQEVYKRGKELKPELCVLFSSGYSTVTFQSDTSLEEKRHLIAKPYKPAQLLEQVRNVLDAGV